MEMIQTALLDDETDVATIDGSWDRANWEQFDQVLDILGRFELYLDECLDQAPGPLLDPWLDEALELRIASL